MSFYFLEEIRAAGTLRQVIRSNEVFRDLAGLMYLSDVFQKFLIKVERAEALFNWTSKCRCRKKKVCRRIRRARATRREL